MSEVSKYRKLALERLFKKHVARYTPQTWWHLRPGGERNRGIGEGIGQNARIGSTITLEGVELAYWPVAAPAYHVTQQELGFQVCRAALIVFMLLGAIGAAGGVCSDFKKSLYKNFTALDGMRVRNTPYNIYLEDSKLSPINSANPAIAARAMLKSDKYGVDYTSEGAKQFRGMLLAAFPDHHYTFEDVIAEGGKAV